MNRQLIANFLPMSRQHKSKPNVSLTLIVLEVPLSRAFAAISSEGRASWRWFSKMLRHLPYIEPLELERNPKPSLIDFRLRIRRKLTIVVRLTIPKPCGFHGTRRRIMLR